ncbi:hypothetical protein EK904_001429 [Melospiza melodia maxima]|nr:hypothetical protein EK904_001429 [Melospiza melodia maxima]
MASFLRWPPALPARLRHSLPSPRTAGPPQEQDAAPGPRQRLTFLSAPAMAALAAPAKDAAEGAGLRMRRSGRGRRGGSSARARGRCVRVLGALKTQAMTPVHFERGQVSGLQGLVNLTYTLKETDQREWFPLQKAAVQPIPQHLMNQHDNKKHAMENSTKFGSKNWLCGKCANDPGKGCLSQYHKLQEKLIGQQCKKLQNRDAKTFLMF